MHTHAENTPQQESRSLSSGLSGEQMSGEQAFQLKDSRQEAIAQRQLQELANTSSQVRQFRTYQQLADSASLPGTVQRKANKTGLPDQLKSGVEQLSGFSMDDVKVHYNSGKPAKLQALAYAQGTDIHVAPGQEKHLPHEAWHVAQQKQGRVRPTMQLKGKVDINNDAGLEQEADVMGAKAAAVVQAMHTDAAPGSVFRPVVQRTLALDLVNKTVTTAIAGEQHGEIPEKEEEKKWEKNDVKVIYESDVASSKKPDPPILRAAFLWTFFCNPALEFWSSILRGEEADGAYVTMNNHRQVAQRLKEELEVVGLGVDTSLDAAYSLLDPMAEGLPPDNAAFDELALGRKQSLAKAKIRQITEIDSLMYRVHKGGSFSDVSFEKQDLMEERSREMLRNITEAELTKTIYKVGDEHIQDMRRLGLKPDPGIKILSRTEYKDEYARADVYRMPGNKGVSSLVGNDEL